MSARCQSCGQTGEVRMVVDGSGQRYSLCADREGCERRQRAMEDVEHMGAAEARTWFPEDEDEEDDMP